jgi:Nucleotidyl transferase of unknown function (DUF2204)
MPESERLAPLLTVLSELVTWFRTEEAPWALIGGVAASLLGSPRPTRNIDALVNLSERRWARFLKAGERLGFVLRRANALPFAQETRVLQMRHQKSGLDVNIVLGSLPFENEVVAGATQVDLGGVSIPLVRPEDLIVMKSVGHRPRDLDDIEAILAAQSTLKLTEMLNWVRKFAEALEMPEILTDLEALILKRR